MELGAAIGQGSGGPRRDPEGPAALGRGLSQRAWTEESPLHLRRAARLDPEVQDEHPWNEHLLYVLATGLLGEVPLSCRRVGN